MDFRLPTRDPKSSIEGPGHPDSGRKDLIPVSKWETNPAIVAAATAHVTECQAYDCPVGKIGVSR